MVGRLARVAAAKADFSTRISPTPLLVYGAISAHGWGLLALNGASISDASGGKLDLIAVYDSRDVAINGFAIDAGSDGVSGANGISCNDWSACRLALNVIQGAGSGAGLAVYQASEATVDGDTVQNNGVAHRQQRQ